MDIVIGTPLVSLDTLGVEDPHFTNERNLAKIMVDLKVFPSMGQIRKNRPDLMIELNEFDCIELKIGKRWFYIIVGE